MIESNELQSMIPKKAKSLEQRMKELINTGDVMIFMKGNRNEPRCGFSRQLMEIMLGKCFITIVNDKYFELIRISYRNTRISKTIYKTSNAFLAIPFFFWKIYSAHNVNFFLDCCDHISFYDGKKEMCTDYIFNACNTTDRKNKMIHVGSITSPICSNMWMSVWVWLHCLWFPIFPIFILKCFKFQPKSNHIWMYQLLSR